MFLSSCALYSAFFTFFFHLTFSRYFSFAFRGVHSSVSEDLDPFSCLSGSSKPQKDFVLGRLWVLFFISLTCEKTHSLHLSGAMKKGSWRTSGLVRRELRPPFLNDFLPETFCCAWNFVVSPLRVNCLRINPCDQIRVEFCQWRDWFFFSKAFDGFKV